MSTELFVNRFRDPWPDISGQGSSSDVFSDGFLNLAFTLLPVQVHDGVRLDGFPKAHFIGKDGPRCTLTRISGRD